MFLYRCLVCVIRKVLNDCTDKFLKTIRDRIFNGIFVSADNSVYLTTDYQIFTFTIYFGSFPYWSISRLKKTCNAHCAFNVKMKAIKHWFGEVKTTTHCIVFAQHTVHWFIVNCSKFLRVHFVVLVVAHKANEYTTQTIDVHITCQVFNSMQFHYTAWRRTMYV